MRRSKCVGLIAAWVMSAFGAAWAAPVWTVSTLFERALAEDAGVRAARAQRDAVAERVIQYKAQRLPNVTLNVSRFTNDIDRTQNNFLGVPSTTQESYLSYNQTLQIRVPIYRPLIGLSIEQTQAAVREAEAGVLREEQALAVRLIDAYTQVVVAQEGMRVVDKQIVQVAEQLDAAVKRFERGIGVRTDIDEVRARIDMLNAQRLTADQLQRTALLQLSLMVQQQVSAVQVGAVGVLPAQVQELEPLDHWMSLAKSNSPDLVALNERLAAAELEVSKAYAGHKPTLDASAQLTRSGSENVTSPASSYYNRQVGLVLNVPIYAGGAVQSAVRQAMFDQRKVEENLESVHRDLQLRVQKEWQGVVQGALRTKAFEAAVHSAKQVELSVGRSFEAGIRTSLDVINANQQVQSAQRDLTEAWMGTIASRLRLAGMAGVLTPELMSQANQWVGASAGQSASK
jgi:protease secretion system outer membrane protein